MEFCFDNNRTADNGVMNLTSSSMDSVSVALLLIYVLIGCGGRKQKQVLKQPSEDESGLILSSPHLLTSQGLLTLLMTTLNLLRFPLLLTTSKNNSQGMTPLCLQTIVWPLSLAVLWMEGRKMIQTSTRVRRLVLAAFWTLTFGSENRVLFEMMNIEWKLNTTQSFTVKLEMILFVLRYSLTLALFLKGLKDALFGTDHPHNKKPLPAKDKDDAEDTEEESPVFENFFGKIGMFLPFMWPKGSPRLQFFVFICVGLLAVGRYLTILRPLCYKQLVDSLTSSSSNKVLTFRWELVVGYIGIEFLEEFMENVSSTLWDQVKEFTAKDVEVQLFSHIQRLSIGWHLSRKTGEVLEITSRGTSCASNLLRYLVFTILPAFADVTIAIIYFMTAFNVWFAMILLVTLILYSVGTYFVSYWVTKQDKEPTRLYTLLHSVRVDSLLNFETVKCFSTEDYEISKYKKCLLECQTASWKQSLAYNALHLIQKFVTTGGLMAGSLLCVFLIASGQDMSMGDYVLFVAYTKQVYSPMYTCGGLYSYMQQCFVKMEKMFDILNAQEDVKDVPQARDLVVTDGKVEFKNVSFSYNPERPILKNVSFMILPGQTVAFVGPTGSGKSTIARLLFRLFDVGEGTILIDDQNIAEVTQQSVRRSIGSVPQDTVLFNTDIRFNIKYGNLDASDEEVEKAAVAAEMHDTILSFPKGYDTKVGERGLKLSGGEKQRIAVARTMLKSAPITLLDEATSALDTKTERSIQSSLNRLCDCKTTIIIAHRLSTIVNAHQICVLKEGQIVEMGTHEALLNLDGEYKQMWQAQMKEMTGAEIIWKENTVAASKEECDDEIIRRRDNARLNPMD